MRGATDVCGCFPTGRHYPGIADHLAAMTGGALGPIVTDEGLDNARIRFGDRTVRLDSPPLSFGELHAALLAIRLGATDFLAGMNINPPLIVDEATPVSILTPGPAAGCTVVQLEAGPKQASAVPLAITT